MRPHEIVEFLIQSDSPVQVRLLLEASVHLSTRGTTWIGTYRDETGKQIWRSTGLRNKRAALQLALRWEAAAKRKRAAQGPVPLKPTIRVRPGSIEAKMGLLTQKEVAMFFHISERAVRAIEKRAFEKLRNHPALKEFWREWQAGEIEENDLASATDYELSREEIAAVLALGYTVEERLALRKLIALTRKFTAAAP